MIDWNEKKEKEKVKWFKMRQGGACRHIRILNPKLRTIARGGTKMGTR